MRNISFSSNSLTNAALTDSATGSLLYELTTPYGFRQNTTLLDDQKNVVGVYMPNGRNDKATYQGHTTRVNDWLVKDVQTGFVDATEMLTVQLLTNLWTSSSRTFVAPDGRTYKWDILSTMGMRWQVRICSRAK
ncbi:uncharacterized protein TRAVEDRAFT_46998 [Trametes versicolor FP-101664 SS1]|uniref:uncharacterized protein n=1 Tax=Trametes versicolor (strain FP-101664) TaxID=717944 RepID=UPI000462122D|nr:uncharacterized protein TRAVEDRAFT_46998 [Trametes versicolor FP-101664 SS1]EIW59695.1 hypothetical protein TRAVEDRAFT_46998 [Trametes versicolor FP-101664 SS1]